MNSYVVLFRQGSPLSEADLQRRSAETAPWARQLNAEGHELEPRILGPETERRGVQSEPNPAALPVTALLFLKAETLAQAAEIAASHPALRYGASVEVRPWAAPVRAAPAVVGR